MEENDFLEFDSFSEYDKRAELRQRISNNLSGLGLKDLKEVEALVNKLGNESLSDWNDLDFMC